MCILLTGHVQDDGTSCSLPPGCHRSAGSHLLELHCERPRSLPAVKDLCRREHGGQGLVNTTGYCGSPPNAVEDFDQSSPRRRGDAKELAQL